MARELQSFWFDSSAKMMLGFRYCKATCKGGTFRFESTWLPSTVSFQRSTRTCLIDIEEVGNELANRWEG